MFRYGSERLALGHRGISLLLRKILLLRYSLFEVGGGRTTCEVSLGSHSLRQFCSPAYR
jgi:hypothetical protein